MKVKKDKVKLSLQDMFLIIAIIVTIIVMSSCVRTNKYDIPSAAQEMNGNDPTKYKAPDVASYGSSAGDTKIILIDQCQYIIVGGQHEIAITHKGNCFNPIHYKTD